MTIKTYLLFLVFCGLNFADFAQNSSRIVFFRMDGDVNKRASSFSEWRAYTDAIMRNGTEIAKIRSASLVVYDAPDVKGTYELIPGVNATVFGHKGMGNQQTAIDPPVHSITIIKLSLSGKTPITSHEELISIDEFRKCYHKNKWLRKKMEEAGYNSVDDLVGGYRENMSQQLPEVVYKCFHPMISRHLSDTFFYDKSRRATHRDTAKFYAFFRLEKDNYYSFKEYYIANGQLEMTGHYTDVDSGKRDGTFTRYYEDGRVNYIENYVNGSKTGKCEYYYDLKNSPLWYSCTYTDGYTDGTLESFYPNSKLKRRETHVIDKVLRNTRRNGVKEHIPYPSDNAVGGKCFDEQGSEMKFTPFFVYPKPPYVLNEYLVSAIVYPRKAINNDAEGRVLVQFLVNGDGRISDVCIVKEASPELDQEAVRVVASMPEWKPGSEDDSKVDVLFTLPIVFTLK